MNRFQLLIFRCGLAALALLCCWSLLHAAEPGTTVVTVEPPADAKTVIAERERGAALTFGLDRIPELQARVLAIPLWQYVASVIYVIIAVFLAKFLDYLVTVQLQKVTGRAKSKVVDDLISLLRSPIRMLALVLMLHFGFDLFMWPDWIERWVKTGFKILLACSLTYMALKVVDVLANFWKSRLAEKADKSFNDLLIPLMSKAVKAFLLIMAVLVTLDNLHFNIRTLLAGVSISGLAIGLAAQDTVGNLFGAAAIFMDKPFKIGDRIQLDAIDGTVEEIGLRSTRIRNLDGHLITVPNKTMGNATITNISQRPNIKTVMNIGVTYDTPAGKVREALEILTDIFKKHPETHDVVIGFNQFADSSLNINVVHWWKTVDFKLYVAGMQEMNLEIKRRFDDAQIGFAFPSRTVYLRQDNEWRLHLPESARA